MTNPTLSPKDVAELRNRILSEWASFKNPAGGLMTSFTGPELEAIAAALASQSLEREGEIRTAAIEECARMLENQAEFFDEPLTGACRINAKLLRALAQQPPAGEKE